jgi:hypothetical protein
MQNKKTLSKKITRKRTLKNNLSVSIADRKLLAPGRQSIFSGNNLFFSNTFLSRRYQETHTIDLTQYATLTADKLLDVLIDSNPDVSQALYSFLRMCNSGHHIKVTGIDGKENKFGQDIMDKWVRKLNFQQDNNGFKEDRSLNSLINKLHMSFFVKGAASVEIAFTQRLEPSFISPVNPTSIYFKSKNDELIPYQLQPDGDHNKGKWEGNYKEINIPSFFYQPFDSRLDDVYGVCPILPSLQIVFFQMQILQDLQLVVHKAGYPRVDVELLEEILIKNAPPIIKNDAKKLTQWLNERKSAIETEYENIKPDDAAIHFDSVKLKYLESQRGLGSFDARALIEVVDAQVIASLKSLSTLMGRKTGRTETYASAEVLLYIKGVEAIQQISGQMMSRVLTFCLNMFGIQGYVNFEYTPIELRSKTELAQWQAIRIRNNLIYIALGMKSFNEGTIELIGHAPSGIQPKEEELREIILAILKANSSQPDRPSTNDNGGDRDSNNNFNTAGDLLDRINGKR